MRSLVGVTLVAAVVGQDIFLAPTNNTAGKVDYKMTIPNAFCKSASSDRVDMTGNGDVKACAALVKANSHCSDVFYSDGTSCKCMKKGKTCEKKSSSAGNNVYQLVGSCEGGDLATCAGSCLKADTDSHFQTCAHDGSQDCSSSKCCQTEGWTCFVKNAYWSSCAPHCKTGIPDKTGETWDCTPRSPSVCGELSGCMDGCRNNCPATETVLESTAACRGGTKVACKAVCKYPNAALEQLCKDGCDANCPDVPDKVCPKADLSTCVAECSAETIAPEHGDKCEKDGSTGCLQSKCCQNPSDKCYTKNPFWAACQSECTAGKPSKLDSMIWDCDLVKPNDVCDPYLYRKCALNCHDQCEN